MQVAPFAARRRCVTVARARPRERQSYPDRRSPAPSRRRRSMVHLRAARIPQQEVREGVPAPLAVKGEVPRALVGFTGLNSSRKR